MGAEVFAVPIRPAAAPRRFRIRALVGALAIAAALAQTAPAAANFGPIRLVSKSATEQAGEAEAPALSADGRYLAFRGEIGGLAGVFREDLQTGALAPVAAASAYDEEAPAADAKAPSISADGRYVSFTTTAQLDPVDDPQPGSKDVYVADMASSPPSYELASAADGSAHGLTYGGAGGSEASGRVALSADGRQVAFITTAASDLGGTADDTPAAQVVLRDLDTSRTTLVSVRRNPGTGGMEPGVPVPDGAVIERPSLRRLAGAALSADGTTVAWLGANLPAQVPLLGDEGETISQLDESGVYPYDEPLWRRVADGPAAPTRRIVGGGDPLAPDCPEGGGLADPACQGPFPGIATKNSDLNGAMGWLGVAVDGVPQLSADGQTVALLGNPTEATNLFLVDMSGGSSRNQAVRQLTREIAVSSIDPAGTINVEPYVPLNGHLFDAAISADGRRIAFATARQQFPLAPPNLITPLPAQVGLVDLYEIDLDGEILRRVTHGYGGETEASLAPSGSGQNGAGADSPSFGAGGSLLAFASSASNLVEGDANEASDAFVVEDVEASRVPGPLSISPGPPAPWAKRRWRLALSAFSLPNGRVRLVAVVPAAGRLGVRVWGKLEPQARARRLGRARKRTRKRAGGAVKLTLKLPRPLRRLAHTREGVYAMARVSFRGRRRVLRGRVQVRFHVHPRKHGKKGGHGHGSRR